MLFNEPKLLKARRAPKRDLDRKVSVLFNEPKLLKSVDAAGGCVTASRFSALQRAEIAEINMCTIRNDKISSFSALQRAEIAESAIWTRFCAKSISFSALQRAEIAEILRVG